MHLGKMISWSMAAFLWYVAFSCLGALAAPPTDISPNLLYYNVQNTTTGSAFMKNLNDVLGHLAASNAPESSVSSGSYPDVVYGSSECYSSRCAECLDDIAGDFRSTSPLALGAQEYRKTSRYQCYLRYENYNFLGNLSATLDTTAPDAVICKPQNSTQGTSFTRNLERLLDNLILKTFGEGSVLDSSGTPPNDIQGFAACYNLSKADCRVCLSRIKNDFKAKCPLAVGARYLVNTSCLLQYENPGASSSVPSQAMPQMPRGSSNLKLIISTVVPSSAFLFMVAACMAYFMFGKKHKAKLLAQMFYFPGNLESEGNFSYDELCTATENFQEHRKLGQGGFGAVYKGTLADGREVAIKRLHVESDRGKEDFLNEVTIVSSIRHRNLVRMDGYCAAGRERLLVLEYVSNGTLDQALHGRKFDLGWPTRRNIILGIARGLAYLHEESQKLIIHRDIKTSNVLLDDQLNPKISDFGISKPFDRDRSPNNTTRIVGTIGYIAPEYALHGELTAKADVFSFGMLTLEIVSGRRWNDQAFPTGQKLLLNWTRQLHLGKQLEYIVDPALDMRSDSSKAEALNMLHIALLCTQPNAESRPKMSRVVAMLIGDLELSPLPVHAQKMDALLASFASEQYTSQEAITVLGPR